MIINDLLQAAVAQGASDIHLPWDAGFSQRAPAHWLPDNQDNPD